MEIFTLLVIVITAVQTSTTKSHSINYSCGTEFNNNHNHSLQEVNNNSCTNCNELMKSTGDMLRLNHI